VAVYLNTGKYHAYVLFMISENKLPMSIYNGLNAWITVLNEVLMANCDGNGE